MPLLALLVLASVASLGGRATATGSLEKPWRLMAYTRGSSGVGENQAAAEAQAPLGAFPKHTALRFRAVAKPSDSTTYLGSMFVQWEIDCAGRPTRYGDAMPAGRSFTKTILNAPNCGAGLKASVITNGDAVIHVWIYGR
jgi:hypothetical protein